MTMDRSLRTKIGLARSRSVLTRAERIARLKSAERWTEGDCPTGLPKVRVIKLSVKKKKKAKKEEEEGAAPAAAAAEAKPAAKPAGKAGGK
jgi:small basic protein (TIGR04137 family)